MKQDPSLVRSRNDQGERVKLDTTQFQTHTFIRLLESSSERMKTNYIVIYVTHRFILNTTKLILLITKSFKTKPNLGIVFATIVKYLIF